MDDESKKLEKRNNQDFLRKQMLDKKDKKSDEKSQNMKQGEIFKIEVVKNEEEDKMKADKIKEKNLEHAKQVVKQMDIGNDGKKNKKQMNAQEVKLNNALLKEIGKDLGAKRML